jgi:hypothetical protein
VMDQYYLATASSGWRVHPVRERRKAAPDWIRFSTEARIASCSKVRKSCLVKILLSANGLTSGPVDSARVNAETEVIASLSLGCYLRSQCVTRVFPLSKHTQPRQRSFDGSHRLKNVPF